MGQVEVDPKQFLAESGNIHYGSLIRYWRKEVIQWHNTAKLVDLYNEVLEETYGSISIRWWQRMEKENTVPVDEKRRRIIATLLNIPPAYLGLTTLTPLLPVQENTVTVPVKLVPLDLEEFEKKLRKFWTSYYSRDTATDSITTRIYTLERALMYGEKQQKERVAQLLCDYLILFGNIRRDQGYSSATIYLDEAVALAKEKGFRELLAKALYIRGYAYLDMWSYLKNRLDLMNALRDLSVAYDLVPGVASEPLKGAILAEWGTALASTASDREDRRKALSKIDQAGAIVSASGFKRDPHFLDVNKEWYHIDKAEAFLVVGWPNSAQEALCEIDKGNPHRKRRYLTMDIIEAEAYAAKGNVDMAVAFVEDALDTANSTQSYTHTARIVNLYERLRQHDKYGNSSDVARLGIKLLKVRMPELFN